MRRKLLAASGGACALCGSTDRPEIDHVRPRHLGGGDDPANLRVLCRRCHKAKTQRESNASSRRRQ